MTQLKGGVSSTVSEFTIVKWFQCRYRIYVHTSASSFLTRAHNKETEGVCMQTPSKDKHLSMSDFRAVPSRLAQVSTPGDYSMATLRRRTSRQIGFAEPVSLFR